MLPLLLSQIFKIKNEAEKVTKDFLASLSMLA